VVVEGFGQEQLMDNGMTTIVLKELDIGVNVAIMPVSMITMPPGQVKF